MYRYIVMALSVAVAFAVVYTLLDLIFGEPVKWGSLAVESIIFGVIMTVIQYFKERKNNKNT